MGLADRIKQAPKNITNLGCHTCKWWPTIRPETQALINEWLDDPTRSRNQLYEILTTGDGDDTEPLLPVSSTGWRFHLRHHDERCR